MTAGPGERSSHPVYGIRPELPALGPAPELPGRGSLLRWHAGALTAYALACVPVAWSAGATGDGWAVTVALCGLPPLMAAVGALCLPLQLWIVPRRLLGRRSRHGRGHVQLSGSDGLAAVLAAQGVTSLRVGAPVSRLVRNRSWVMGRRAVIALSPLTLRFVDAAPFVVAHEAAHVVRRDTLRFLSGTYFAYSLLVAGVASAHPVTVAVAAPAALVLLTGCRWSCEIACDAIALRWVGPAAAAGWLSYQDRLAGAERGGTGRLGRRAVGLVTHPPRRLRRRLLLGARR